MVVAPSTRIVMLGPTWYWQGWRIHRPPAKNLGTPWGVHLWRVESLSEYRSYELTFPSTWFFLSPKHSKTQKSRLNFSDDWWTRPQVCSVSRMCEPVACWMTPAFRVYPHVWLLSYPPKIYISYWSPNRSDPITRRSSGAYRIWDIMGSMEQKWASGRPLRIWWLADMSVCIYK